MHGEEQAIQRRREFPNPIVIEISPTTGAEPSVDRLRGRASDEKPTVNRHTYRYERSAGSDREQPPFTWDALQLVRAPVLEVDA